MRAATAPCLFKPLVRSRCFRHGPQDGTLGVTDPHKVIQRLAQRSDGIFLVVEPRNRSFEYLTLQPFEEGLHQVVEIMEILVEGRPTHAGNRHQVSDRHIPERPRPEQLECAFQNCLARSI
jgi:hypothetical protein